MKIILRAVHLSYVKIILRAVHVSYVKIIPRAVHVSYVKIIPRAVRVFEDTFEHLGDTALTLLCDRGSVFPRGKLP